MSIFNSYNCGVLGFHTKRIAENGFVGMGFTNAPASIAPIGGKKAVVGTNPFSIAVPLEGEAAIIIDQSQVLLQKVKFQFVLSQVSQFLRAGLLTLRVMLQPMPKRH